MPKKKKVNEPSEIPSTREVPEIQPEKAPEDPMPDKKPEIAPEEEPEIAPEEPSLPDEPAEIPAAGKINF
jgi:hypothetical protein